MAYWSQTWREMPLQQKQWWGATMLAHLVLSVIFISWQGVNYDEPDYFRYVYNWAKGNPERNPAIMDSKTPMVAFALIPTLLKPLLPPDLLANDIFFYLKAGRPFIYIYQLLGAFVVCCWMYRVTGPKKWILPFLFFCFDPLVFSYSMFIGSDLPVASLLVTVMYASWRYCETGRKNYWYLLAVTMSFAVLTKASMVYGYPLLLVLFTFNAWANNSFHVKKGLKSIVGFLIIQVIIINLVYYGKDTLVPFGQLPFESHLLSSLQASFSFAAQIPVPLPAAFMQGFDLLQLHSEMGGCQPGSTYNGVFLLNHLYCNKSLWYYYFVTALFKFPLLIWTFIVVFAISVFRDRNIGQHLKANLFIWLPFAWFLLLLSVANKFQIGIRHAILLLPFLYLGLANTINWLYDKYKTVFVGMLLLHIISVSRFLPNLVGYTNELVWNKTKAYKIIRDSSLDYGQAEPWLRSFLKEHTEYKIPTNIPDTGRFAISVGNLFTDNEKEGSLKNIAWLRNHFEPTTHYRFSIMLYDISKADLKTKGLLQEKLAE